MNTSSNPSETICGFCGLSDPNLRRCARCQCISYCSKEHQKVHWKIHKKQCVAPPVQADNNLLSPVSRSALENPVVLTGISGKSFNSSSHGINEDNKKSKINYKGNDKHSEVSINLGEKFAAVSNEQQQQQCQSETMSVPSISQNGTTFHDGNSIGAGVKNSKRNTKKSKPTSRNGLNSRQQQQEHNSNLVKNDEENLENYSPYPHGRTRAAIINPSVNNSTSPTNAHAANSINSGLNLTNPNMTPNSNPKTTPVAISSPLVSTSSCVNSSTPTNGPGNGNNSSILTNNSKKFPFLHRNSLPTSPQQRNHWVLQICKQVISDMDNYGICVVDNLLGEDRGELVYKEVQSLYTSGSFTDGQVVKEGGGTGSHAVRGDKIAWIDGREPKCENIAFLIQIIDSIVIHANKLKDNGKLGSYTIRERTKAMVACYPGSGTHYVKHVDNPNHDGRCVTSIYYLNKDWDTKEYGGLLRIFPEGWTNQVADIEPLFDRVLFFWSDRRNPHEVQPAFKTRYAITLWYFDTKEREEARARGQIQS